MGRGDKRTRKGKTFKGSYGNARPQRDGQEAANIATAKAEKAAKPAEKKAPAKKAPAKKAAAKKED